MKFIALLFLFAAGCVTNRPQQSPAPKIVHFSTLTPRMNDTVSKNSQHYLGHYDGVLFFDDGLGGVIGYDDATGEPLEWMTLPDYVDNYVGKGLR